MEEHNPDEQQLEGKFRTAYEVVEHRLAAIWGAIDSIDTKINIALGFASAILALLAGFYYFGPQAWPVGSLVLFGLAVAAYIVLVVFSILAYRTRAWSYKPDVRTLLKHCQDKKYGIVDIRAWVADEAMNSCYENLDKLKKKATLTNRILLLLAVQTLLLVSGIAYALFAC